MVALNREAWNEKYYKNMCQVRERDGWMYIDKIEDKNWLHFPVSRRISTCAEFGVKVPL